MESVKDELKAEVARLDSRFEKVKDTFSEVADWMDDIDKRVRVLEMNAAGIIPQDE